MVNLNWAFCAGLVAHVAATVAPGFPVRGSPDLNVTWGDTNVNQPGSLLPRAVTAKPPSEISTPVWTGRGKAILMFVDLDVPRNGTRVQLLHWLTANVTRPSSDTQMLKTNDASLDIAPYLQPSPPVNDIPHKYTLLLFEQPVNFTIPARFKDAIKERVGWDTAAFVNATGLGDALAADWIRVENRTTGAGANASASATSSASASKTSGPSATPSGYAGAAAGMKEPRAWLGVVVMAGLMAVVL